MAQTKAENLDELASVVQQAAEGLSARAVAALVAHPAAVKSALAVTAHTLSSTSAQGVERIDGPHTPRVNTTEAERRMDAHTQPGATEDVLTSDELAAGAHLKTRQSVHDWLKKGRIVGWQGAKRGYVFPAGQLDERGHPLAGIERVAPLFEDGYAAWVWLTTPLAALDGKTPLACLREGEIDRAVAAAEGDAQGDFA